MLFMNADRINKLLNIRANEWKVLAWAMLYVFSLFLAYYLLRPVRDELGVAGGVNNLPWLFSGTLVAMLILTPVFSFLVKRFSRITVIKLSYHFFAAHLVVFFILLLPAFSEYRIWTGRVFFIWVSVFNLFVVSIFWSLIVDIFNPEQGLRLFGILSAGATLGAMVGSLVTLMLVEIIDQRGLVLLAFLMLELSLLSAHHAVRHAESIKEENGEIQRAERPLGGSVFAGITHTLRSPYLSGIAVFMILYSLTSTFLYLEQARIAASAFSDRAARTQFFATIDLWVNIFTLIAQLLLTSRTLKRLGISLTLAILPLVTLAGFSLLLAFPSLIIFVVFQVVRRISNFSFARPSREILFTRVNKEERYKSKNFIDTVVYRLGDQLGSWSYAGLLNFSGSAGLLAYIAIPLSLIWLALSLWLGSKSPFIPLKSGGD
ncbi:MFS transporter (plasmid) [Pantoea cypripedii]|uniref:MFS transporter n=2 Tax=Pantoea cypripedii TaxID=55209 RepID=A0A6B9GG53_PANCY|nr:MFS transporter [Pantoea cypripedii]